MDKSTKVFWGVIVGLVILVIAAVMVTALFLDKIVKKGVETVGPQIVKVSVNLDEVHIGLVTGSATVKGLVIGNPTGYKTPNAIRVGTAAIGVDPLSIFSDKIVVHTVVVESPEITFEGGLGGNNLSTIMDNVNAGGKAGAAASAKAAPAKPAKKIEVDDLLITGAKVHVSLTEPVAKEMTLTLPDIHLTDLGKGAGGITATDLTRSVLGAITAATIKAVAADATNIGKDIGKDVQNLGGGGADKLKQGLGGLLGK
jgi:CBS domain-containing protein